MTQSSSPAWSFNVPNKTVNGQTTQWEFLGEGPDTDGSEKVPGCGAVSTDTSLMQSGATRLMIDDLTNGGTT